MLKQRIITAIVLSLSVIASIFYLPATGFRVLALLVTSVGFWEFWMFFDNSVAINPIAADFSLRSLKKTQTKACNCQDYKNKYKINTSIIYLFVFVLICVPTLVFIPANLTLSIGVLWWILVPYFLWVYNTGFSNSIPSSPRSIFSSFRGAVRGIHNLFENHTCCASRQLKFFLLGLLIFVPFFISLITLKEKFGPSILIHFIAIVCSADIGAYFAGRFFGKKLLAAKISPKKTIEGVFGGLLLALIVAKFIGFSSILLLLVIVICLWSVIGDLFESMLKRIAGIKDSGKILPGHGGVYDRIDSLTATLPIFALIIQYI